MGKKVKAAELQSELQKSKVYTSSNGYNVFFENTKNYYTYEDGKIFETEIVNFEDINVGDYIDYPVYYDNVTLGEIAISNNSNRWRVVEKVEDGENYIKIIPTGVPLSIKYNSTGKTLSNIWEYPYIFSDPTDSNYSYLYIEESAFKNSSNSYMENLYDLKNLFVNNIYTKKDENFEPSIEFLNKKDIENLLQTTITETISITDNDLLSIPMESGYANIIIQDNDTNEIWCIDSDGKFKSLTDTGIYGLLPVITLKSSVMFSKSNEKINNNTVYDIFIDESEEYYPENYVLYANFANGSLKRYKTSFFKVITNIDVSGIQVTNHVGREVKFESKCTKYNNLNMWELSWKLYSLGNNSFIINFLDENGEIIYTTTKKIYTTAR